MPTTPFLVNKHKIFFKRCLDIFPEAYEQLDTSRLTLLFFAVSGLDILNALDEISESTRKNIISWIYSLQIKSENAELKACGFRGTFTNASIADQGPHIYDTGHLAMTYTGLSCLLILGNNLSEVDRSGVLSSIGLCQLSDGSFCAHPGGSENDMRFVYCAVAVCYILKDFRSLDLPKLIRYILLSFNYDGGFGQGPGCESHGGSTFCAVASLHMLNELNNPTVFSNAKREKLIRWCVSRQSQGFHGRPNKPDDSCYSFWIGSTLQLLDALNFVDKEKIIEFTLSTQDETVGGFGKYPDSPPDALHSYLSLAGMSVLGSTNNLQLLNPALNICQRSCNRLTEIFRQPQRTDVSSGRNRCPEES